MLRYLQQISPDPRASADSAVGCAARCSPGAPHNAKTGAAAPAPVSPVFRTGSEPLLSPRLRPAHPTHLGSVTHMHMYLHQPPYSAAPSPPSKIKRSKCVSHAFQMRQNVVYWIFETGSINFSHITNNKKRKDTKKITMAVIYEEPKSQNSQK